MGRPARLRRPHQSHPSSSQRFRRLRDHPRSHHRAGLPGRGSTSSRQSSPATTWQRVEDHFARLHRECHRLLPPHAAPTAPRERGSVLEGMLLCGWSLGCAVILPSCVTVKVPLCYRVVSLSASCPTTRATQDCDEGANRANGSGVGPSCRLCVRPRADADQTHSFVLTFSEPPWDCFLVDWRRAISVPSWGHRRRSRLHPGRSPIDIGWRIWLSTPRPGCRLHAAGPLGAR
jgi:hypothetical protein